MKWKISLTVMLLCIAQGGWAQDEAKIEAFNGAWKEYSAAVKSGNRNAAVEAARNVLDAGHAVLPAADSRIAILTQNYGSTLLAAGKTDEAREQLEVAVELLTAEYGKDAIELISALAELADASSGVGNDHEQVKLYKRALAISAEHQGDTSPEYGALAFQAGRNVYEMSQSRIGEKYIKIARKIFVAEYGADDANVGMADLYLGKISFSSSRHKQAARYLEEALATFVGDSGSMKSLRLITRALLVDAYESRGKTDLATPHCVAIGAESEFSPDQDYTPIFRLAPQYPVELLAQGVEGFVDLEFTVDVNGFVQNPQVLQSKPGTLPRRGSIRKLGRGEDASFEAAAMEAVNRFRFAPRFVEGEAVAVDGVKTRISFQLVE